MPGFIKTYRNEPFLNDNDNEPYDRVHAWIDLRMRANWKPGVTLTGKRAVSLEKGELQCSLGELAQRWNWPRQRVARFLKSLERGGLIVITAASYAGTRIMITHPEEWKR